MMSETQRKGRAQNTAIKTVKLKIVEFLKKSYRLSRF